MNNTNILSETPSNRYSFLVKTTNFTLENAFVDNVGDTDIGWGASGVVFYLGSSGIVRNVTFGGNVLGSNNWCIALLATNNVEISDSNCTAIPSASFFIINAKNSIIKNNRVNGAIFFGNDVYGNIMENNTIYEYLLFSLAINQSVYDNTFLNNKLSSAQIANVGNNSYRNYFIYNNSYGEIKWYRSNFSTTAAIDLSVGNNIFIANNLIGLADNVNLANFNVSAEIKFYGLNYSSKPYLLKNGIRCDNNPALCNISYNKATGTLDANVSGFSNYTTNISTSGGGGSGCGDIVTTSIILTGNLSSNGSSSCFRIGANNIVLDGGGHTITGHNYDYYGIENNGYDNVTITNFVFKHFNNGIYWVGGANNGVIQDNIVHDTNDVGMYISNGQNNLIENNNVSSTSSYGIQVISGSHNTLINNEVNKSYSYEGIMIQGSSYNKLIGNYLHSNGQGIGIASSSFYNNISGNNVVNNNHYGIYIYSDSTNNTLTDNTFCFNNQSGGSYYDYGDADSTIETNTTCDTSFPGGVCDNACTAPPSSDVTPPVIAIISPLNGATYSTTSILANFTVNGTGTQPSNITLLIYKKSDLSIVYDGFFDNIGSGTNMTCYPITNNNETFECDNIIPLPNEYYGFQVIAHDFGGNEASDSSVSFNISAPIAGTNASISINYLGGDIAINSNHIFNVTLNVSCSGADCGEINVSLDPSDEYVFTNCGQTGNLGPNQTQCNNEYSGTSLDGQVRVNNGIQFWTVPSGVTSITINVSGASGGYDTSSTPGKGAFMSGTFAVSPGQVLAILVGQSPGNSTYYTGGGGGSFVAITTGSDDYSSANPLIVAGGGGGAKNSAVGIDAPITEDGTGDVPGTGGNGAPALMCSGGGGGFYSNGGDDTEYPGEAGAGGYGFRQGGNGGYFNSLYSSSYQSGGFGGGAEADYIGFCNTVAGSGGGYGGGSATPNGNWKIYGEAGGSYNSGTDQVNSPGANSGNGIVIITSNGKGLISNVPGATPFSVNESNPRTIVLNDSESQLVTFWVNATIMPTSPRNYTFFAYANLTLNMSAGAVTNNWTVTVYPRQKVEFVPAIQRYYNTTNLVFNLTALYFLDHIYSIWWNNETGNLTYSGQVNASFSEGNHTIVAYANDSEGNVYSNVSSFIVDTTPPEIHIIYPSNETYNTTVTEFVFNVSDANIMSCWYSLDGGLTNTTVACNSTINVTGLYSGRGTFNWTAYAEDHTGAISSDSVTFFANASAVCGDSVDQSIELSDNLDCSSYYNDALTIDASNLVLDCNGNSIMGTGNYNGIYLDGVTNVTVKNCTISNFEDGIYFDNANGNNILHNYLDSDYYGLDLDYSQGNYILQNEIVNSEYGFYVWYSDSNVFKYNNVYSYLNFGSCPFAYTWNGTSYNFVADISGSASMGSPRGNSYRKPVPGDYAKIEGSQLQQNNNAYNIQIAQEYDEISYLDELSLLTVDHSPTVDVFTTLVKANLGTIYTVSKNPAAPVSCIDGHGKNCLQAVLAKDGNYTDSRKDETNTLELNLGNLSAASNIKLIISGFSGAWSKTSNERFIQVKNAHGDWVNVYSGSQLNTPAGLPRTYVINLTGKFLTNDYSVRIGYSAELYINYVAVDTTPQQPVTVSRISPSSADLHFRGYSELSTGTPAVPDYYTLVNKSTFSNPSGNFTKFGNVTPLLTQTDDKFVIMHHGDEISTEFAYSAVPTGMARDFFLYSWDYYKSFDKVNGTTVNPLPFKAMSNYPYPSNESYPSDADHLDYLSQWNTREYTGGNGTVGMSLPYSFNNTVIGNNLTGEGSGLGLYLEDETNTSIINNTISNYSEGIETDYSEGTLVSGNDIKTSGGNKGIYFYENSSAQAFNNLMTGFDYGFYIINSDPLIWHNNVYNNSDLEAYSNNPINLSYNNEGNYWGHSCPNLFIAGNDSNDVSVVDSYPYASLNGWLTGEPGGCSGGRGGGGGGGGGGTGSVGFNWPIGTYEVRWNMMQVGYNVYFEVGNSSHTLSLYSVTPDAVVFILSSSPRYITVKNGEKVSVDINGDGFADIAITVLGINGNLVDVLLDRLSNVPVGIVMPAANVTIVKNMTTVPPKEEASPKEPLVPPKGEVKAPEQKEVNAPAKTNLIGWLVAGIIVVAGLVTYITISMRRKKRVS